MAVINKKKKKNQVEASKSGYAAWSFPCLHAILALTPHTKSFVSFVHVDVFSRQEFLLTKKALVKKSGGRWEERWVRIPTCSRWRKKSGFGHHGDFVKDLWGFLVNTLLDFQYNTESHHISLSFFGFTGGRWWPDGGWWWRQDLVDEKTRKINRRVETIQWGGWWWVLHTYVAEKRAVWPLIISLHHQ